MSGWGDMSRDTGALWLDDPTVEQLLAGVLAPEDAPPPLAPVAEWVRAARAPATAAEWADEDTVVAAIAERVRWAASLPAPAERPRRARIHGGVVARVAVLTAALALSGTGVAAAAEGTLPSPVQRAVSTAASWVGVSVPKVPPNSTPTEVPDTTGSEGLAPPVTPAPGARPPPHRAGRQARSAASTGVTRCAPGVAAVAAGPPFTAPTTTVAPPAPTTTVPAPAVVPPVQVVPTTTPSTVPRTVPPTEHPPVSLVTGGPPQTTPPTTTPPTTAPGTTVPPTTVPTTVPTTTVPPTTTPPPTDPGTIPTSPGPPGPVTSVPDPAPPSRGTPGAAGRRVPAHRRIGGRSDPHLGAGR